MAAQRRQGLVLAFSLFGFLGTVAVTALEPLTPSRDVHSYFDSISEPEGHVAFACMVPQDCPRARTCVGGGRAGLFCRTCAGGDNAGDLCVAPESCPGGACVINCPGGACGPPDACSLEPNGSDAVEARMSAAGVTLNGNVTVEKNLALSAWEFDRVPDEDGNPPTIKALGFFGDAESPRFPGGAPDPNGFNIAESVILFVRDSDPSDGIDDSFLYFGWDIADGHPSDSDGVPPVQYDSDDDGSASELGPCTIAPCAISDRALESYAVLIQGCVDEAVFDPDFFTCASDGTTMCDTDADCPNGDCGSDLLADPNARGF